jgi:demethylmacrocin O-methyltransferase
MYAIEDTQTSYFPRWGGSFDLDEKSTTMGLVKSLIDGLNYEEWSDADYTPTYSDLHVVAVHCYHNLVVLEKGSNREGSNRKPSWNE